MSSKLSVYIQRQVKKGISILREGGILAFPTDTVYGLGACSHISQAVEQVYVIKGRPLSMALPLLVADVAQIVEVAECISPTARLLIRNFLPGALTLVLTKSGLVPDIITAGGMTVAIRIPNHPIPLALIQGVGVPIVGTSANLSGRRSPLTADEVYAQFGDKIDFIIDGGSCPGGEESTIVDVTGQTPIILREGAISGEELKRVCGNITLKEGN